MNSDSIASLSNIWMTDWLRDMIRRRRRLFRKNRRRGNWISLKNKISEIATARKARDNKNILEGFLKNTDSRNFHRVVKRLLGENSPPKWSPESMYPDKTQREAAEELAAFFNNISSEYEPLAWGDVPATFSRPLPPLKECEVADMLKSCKKKQI